jgi:hypothetical protein
MPAVTARRFGSGRRVALIRGRLGEMGHMVHQFTTRPWTGFFPHSAPPSLSWAFVGLREAWGMFGLVLVEECGVQWGAVE